MPGRLEFEVKFSSASQKRQRRSETSPMQILLMGDFSGINDTSPGFPIRQTSSRYHTQASHLIQAKTAYLAAASALRAALPGRRAANWPLSPSQPRFCGVSAQHQPVLHSNHQRFGRSRALRTLY